MLDIQTDFLKPLCGLQPCFAPQAGLTCFALEDLALIRQFLLEASAFDVYQTAVTQAQEERSGGQGETSVLAPFTLNDLPPNPWKASQAFGLLFVFLNDGDVDAALLLNLTDTAHQAQAATLLIRALTLFSGRYPSSKQIFKMVSKTKEAWN
jgi:hypothetical protein